SCGRARTSSSKGAIFSKVAASASCMAALQPPRTPAAAPSFSRARRGSGPPLEDPKAGLVGDRQHLRIPAGVAVGRGQPHIGAEPFAQPANLLLPTAVFTREGAGDPVIPVEGEFGPQKV